MVLLSAFVLFASAEWPTAGIPNSQAVGDHSMHTGVRKNWIMKMTADETLRLGCWGRATWPMQTIQKR